MKAYSEDLRLCILRAVDAGMAKSEAARVFGVSRSAIKRYAQQRRETGGAAPKAPPPPRSLLIGPDRHATLRAYPEAAPDATLAAHCARWEREQGVRVSEATMHRAIARLGWTRKTRRWAPPNGTRRTDQPGKGRPPASTPPLSSSSTRPARTGG